MDNPDAQSQLLAGVREATLRILRSLVRILLRHGVSFHAFSDLARQAYVDVARDEFALPGRKPSISRIAVLTGLTRKDVQRLLETPAGGDARAAERHNRAARVVAGWVRDGEFRSGDGEPLALPFDGLASFSELVRRYSGDATPRAVLDELERVGTVERGEDGRIRLLARVYLPRHSDLAKLRILGTDVPLLIGTIEHNMLEPGQARFQRKVMYDNLPAEAVAELQPLAARQAQELIERLDTWMAQHDRDTNPAAGGSGRVRAGLGIFYFESEVHSDPRENSR